MNIYEKALEKWGEDLQIATAIEEMAELIKALIKSKRGKDDGGKSVREEIADVEIMLEQLKMIYGDVRMIKDQKLIRLAKMLEKDV